MIIKNLLKMIRVNVMVNASVRIVVNIRVSVNMKVKIQFLINFCFKCIFFGLKLKFYMQNFLFF